MAFIYKISKEAKALQVLEKLIPQSELKISPVAMLTMKTFIHFILVCTCSLMLQGCMSLSGTFNTPENQEKFQKEYGEPNECNKIFIGTRFNVYFLSNKPHGYQISYYDFLPSLIMDAALLPFGILYTSYIYAKPLCIR